jgi:hypothetical protein
MAYRYLSKLLCQEHYSKDVGLSVRENTFRNFGLKDARLEYIHNRSEETLMSTRRNLTLMFLMKIS